MRAAKVNNTKVEFKVWCGICHIRLAPNEERARVRGKTYHSSCYSKYLDHSRRD
jgi:hypothetical protein